MLHIRKFFIPILVVLGITSFINVQSFQLANFNYKSASVLPTFVDEKGIKWVDIGREGFGRTKKHTYDDWSGGRSKREHNPLTSAAREFLEEHILERVLGWSLADTEKFILENLEVVVAYSRDKNPCNPQSRDARNVTYIVDFNKYATELFNNFYEAREQEEARYDELGTRGKYRTTTEKDRIAKVKWNDLKDAIEKYTDTSQPLYVQALVLDPATKYFYRQEIKLRPFLGIKLRPFFLDQLYETGENEKVRFYK